MAFDTSPKTDVDVAICGAGLAGLTLARQIQREHPGVTIAVIDRLERPLPEAAFKVGESTVELAAYYMREMLDLKDYLDKNHLRKMGLRMFFPPTEAGRFAERPEYGLSKFATIPTHQIDRGRLENDMRAMVEADGARLIEGARIDRLDIGKGGDIHTIHYYHGKDDHTTALTARWIVDAAGRSRMIARQLDLGNRREADHNAVWFRVDGRLDVDDLVPASEKEWHDRVPGKKRWFSTNHLVNKGYWVWVIPLAGNRTSVGIVALKDLHPIEEFKNLDLSVKWLEKREPDFARELKKYPLMDFGIVRNYSHTSKQVFSADRWACTGDAGVFADPLYSPGSDLIAFANTAISWMIGEDVAGRLTPEAVEEKSRFVISIGELLTRSIQVNYHLLGSPQAMAAKLFWDITAGWAVVQPLLYGKIFLDSQKHAKVRAAGRQFFFLSLQMNQLFLDWAEKASGRATYQFIDYFSVDAIRLMRERNLIPDKPVEDLVADQEENLRLMEEMAQVILRVAVEDVYPEHAHKLEGKWLNAWSVALDPATWEARGLFAPRTAPRDLSRLRDPFYEIFGIHERETA